MFEFMSNLNPFESQNSYGFGGYGTEGAFDKYFNPDERTKSSSGIGGLVYDTRQHQMVTNSASGVGGLSQLTMDEAVEKTVEGINEKSDKKSGDKLQALGRALAAVKSPNVGRASTGRIGGGGFRAPGKTMAQSLLDREYASLYNAPLYTNLTK